LRVKEHPSSKVAVTDEINALIASGARIVLDNATDSFAQIAASAGVITINSSMGLQAMFWDKPVVITGEALYDIEGAVMRADSAEALGALCAQAAELSFDADLRARMLTWLARDYYVSFDQGRLLEPEQIQRIRARGRAT
jgi:capsular polysaccharide export protein